MAELFEERARVFKAFDDEKRLRILELLRGGERCALELIEAMDMPQSTLSYHMKMLCESGVVTGRQAGKWTYYRISGQGGEAALALLCEILAVNPAAQGGAKRDEAREAHPAAAAKLPAQNKSEQKKTEQKKSVQEEQAKPAPAVERPRSGSSWSDDFFLD